MLIFAEKKYLNLTDITKRTSKTRSKIVQGVSENVLTYFWSIFQYSQSEYFLKMFISKYNLI